MNFPKICVVDTNVPKTANRAIESSNIPADEVECIQACVMAIEHVIKNRESVVIDESGEIFAEYLNNLSMSGSPGLGDHFVKWIHDNQWYFPEDNRVTITKTSASGESYKEFPDHTGLSDFDISDRKFVAVACAHPDKPEILQATDSKWWGWAQALKEVGISVRFLCPEYIQKKYKEKSKK